MPLTKLECDRAACPDGKPALRLADEKGMYLEVTAAGGKYWQKRLALGVYPAVSLAQVHKAREIIAESCPCNCWPAPPAMQTYKALRA